MYITTIADSYVQINYSLSLSLSHEIDFFLDMSFLKILHETRKNFAKVTAEC